MQTRMIFTPWQKYKTNKAQKANFELRSSIGYTEAASFGIIFHNDEPSKIDAAEKLSTLLKMDKIPLIVIKGMGRELLFLKQVLDKLFSDFSERITFSHRIH